VALVTGGSAGIGLALARRLAMEGHDLVLVARDATRLRAAADELERAHGAGVEVLAADLSDREQLQTVADRLADADRPVDVLVNNAGFALHSGFLRSEVADQERLLGVHCRATLVLTHAAGRAMAARGRGAVVNVSSVAALTALGSYAAAKAWVSTFSEAMAVELAPKGVTVTALHPGYVRTELVGDLADKLPKFAFVDGDRLAQECMAAVARGRVIVTPTKRYAVASAVLRRLPRGAVRAVSGGRRVRRVR